MSQEIITKLIVSLFNYGAIKFGQYTLKSGIQSPVYFDLRIIISHPSLMKLISELVWEEKEKANLDVDVICGVPYTALPIASLVSVLHDVPMILKRQEQKKYGTGKLIEGDYKENARCLIIEDVITTGSSIIETADILRQHGLVVTDAIVILDRDQGAVTNLSSNGIRTISMINMSTMLEVLCQEGLINSQVKIDVEIFISANKLSDIKVNQALQERISVLKNPSAKTLLQICCKKSTNLCLSADLDHWTDVIDIAKQLGPHICLLKTHIDTLNFENYSQVLAFREQLKALSEEFEFLIMEDRKLADIGNTAVKQLTAKPFEIEKWAHFVTVHGISGPSIFQSVADCNLNAVAIAELSCEGNIMTKVPEYKRLVKEMSEGFSCVSGFVSQSDVDVGSDSQKYLQFTPGVSLDCVGDGRGQVYSSIESAVLQRNADIIIVGRAIYKSRDSWIENAKTFQARGWKALCERVVQPSK